MRTRTKIYRLGAVPKEIADAIYSYGVAVEVASEEAVDKAAKQTKNFMKRKNVTPERKESERKNGDPKAYRTLFKVYSPRKKRKDYHWRVVGNKHYRLDHLLQDGHLSYNQYGGPYVIDDKKRVHRGLTGSGWTDENHTTYYKMWDKGYKYADASFYGDLLDILEASGCIEK